MTRQDRNKGLLEFRRWHSLPFVEQHTKEGIKCPISPEMDCELLLSLVLKEFTKSKRELANFLLGFKLCALGITWLYKYYAKCLLSLLFICDAYRKRILLYCVIIT